MTQPAPVFDIRRLYDGFDAPLAGLDCGKKCAPHNPRGIPFCCDVCQAVPAVYHQEWDYLQAHTRLWHPWHGDECPGETNDPAALLAETPPHMTLLACRGPQACERPYRALSCRQFPFFPYITSDGRFIGLACYWDFEPYCWIIQNLGVVSAAFRSQFTRTFDAILAAWDAEFESYAVCSEDLREHYANLKRRFPLLHRSGGLCRVSPVNERLYWAVGR